jgi:hypothetical protein
MWLLDVNVDLHLLGLLREFGVPSEAAMNLGWQELSNGELVRRAARHGFTCLLTRDRLLGTVASKALREHPNFAVVLVALPQRPWPLYERHFRAAWSASPILPVAGRAIAWPR